MDLVKHEIKVVDDEPFKKGFQRMHSPMVDEVYVHVKENVRSGHYLL